MIRRITVEQVIRIYDERVANGHLRDRGALENAVAAPFHSFQGFEPYPTLAQKAGKLLDGIQRAQAYIDGNKRLAWLSANAFVEVNGQRIISLPAEEVDEFVRYLAVAPDGAQEAAWWLNERLVVGP